MGKELERLIIILAIILLSGTAFAVPAPEALSGDNTVVVTRERKTETKTTPKATTPKVTAQNKAIPQCPYKKKKVAKKQNKPQYIGLKIYETPKPKINPKVKKATQTKCKDDPTSICNLRKLKPRTLKVEKPRYTKRYVTNRYTNNRYTNNRYKKYKLPNYPPAKPARPIPIITCY